MAIMVRLAYPGIFVMCLAASMAGLSGCEEPKQVELPLVPRPPTVEVKPLVPLSPGRRTHTATDSRGNLYFLQETSGGQDVLFDVSQSGNVSRQLDLTSARLLEQLKAAGGNGNIHSLAMAKSDRLCFYFVGGKGHQTIAALGTFDTRDSRITFLATTSTLAQITGMGDSLELARGTLIAGAGTEMWLWLRHSDAGVLLRFDALGLDTGAGLQLKRPFPAVRGPKRELIIRTEQDEMSAGPTGSLFYVDRKAAVLWKIDPEGKATQALSLNGAPSVLTPPWSDAKGRLIMLAGDSDQLSSHDFEADMDHAFGVTQPSLLFLENGKLAALDRNAFKAPDLVALQTLQPQQLLPFRERDTWVTYDRASGQLLQIKIVGGQ